MSMPDSPDHSRFAEYGGEKEKAKVDSKEKEEHSLVT